MSLTINDKSHKVSTTPTDWRPVNGRNVNRLGKNTYTTPIGLIRVFIRLRSEQLWPAIKTRLDWVFKSWNNYLLGLSELDVNHKFMIENYHQVIKRVRMVRIAPAEPGMISVFERMFNTTLPEISPITKEDIDSDDRETLDAYIQDKSMNLKSTKSFTLALAACLRLSGLDEFSQSGPFRLLTFQEAADSLPKDTSSCYPLFRKKGSETAFSEATYTIGKMFQVKDDINQLLKIMWGQLTVVFHRISLSLKEIKRNKRSDEFVQKIRQVFGVPYSIVLLESMFFGRLSDYLCNNSVVFTYGSTRPEISARIEKFIASGRNKECFIVSGDIKGCDASLPPSLVLLFFSSMEHILKVPSTLKVLYRALSYYLTFTPVMGYDSQVIFTSGGNTSGTKTTSLLNSFSLYLALQYFSFETYGCAFEANECQVMGDDFICLVRNKNDLERLRACFAEFGLTLHPTKTAITHISSEFVSFLGFNWERNKLSGEFEPDQTDGWVVGHICYPERFIDDLYGIDRTIARTMSIIFQIKRGKELCLELWKYDKAFRKRFRKANGSFDIRIIKTGDYLTDTVIPFRRKSTRLNSSH